ncbi:hypothetical protein AB0F88_07785 [Streptosporangium sp. NPDC023963]|uniref:hypothetical protein n=1 Tax=Streptosporangium sp. NPDC023963 TaxID=3155608 RepID=UPI003415F412
MNEFQIVDRVMPDVPPSEPARVAAIRAGILESGPRGRRPGRTYGRGLATRFERSRRPGRFGWMVAAVATAAVVAAVVVVPRLGETTEPPVSRLESPPPDPRPSATTSRKRASSDPKGVLKEIADRLAARSESPSGRYWRVRSQTTKRRWVEAAVDRSIDYKIVDHTVETLWLSSGRPVIEERRYLGAEPSTPEDLARWKERGSPRLCEYGVPCPPGEPARSPTRYLLDAHGESSVHLVVKDLYREPEDSMRLPADPKKLRTTLLTSAPVFKKRRGPGYVRDVETSPDLKTRDEWLSSAALNTLLWTPTSPATRAAVYLMLADLPGNRVSASESEVKLIVSTGRRGAEEHLVIDRGKGDPSALLLVSLRTDKRAPATLSKETGLLPANVETVFAFEEMGWTDEAPLLPEGCVRGAGPEKCAR